MTCLVALNRIEQVEFHLKKALENGLTKDELVAAITHIAFYAGWPTAASGFGHLKKRPGSTGRGLLTKKEALTGLF